MTNLEASSETPPMSRIPLLKSSIEKALTNEKESNGNADRSGGKQTPVVERSIPLRKSWTSFTIRRAGLQKLPNDRSNACPTIWIWHPDEQSFCRDQVVSRFDEDPAIDDVVVKVNI
jgi:hypothetical protein